MNTAREIVQAVTESGGHLWAEGGRVRGRNIPRRLLPAIKAQEAGILALLQSAPATVTCGTCAEFEPGTPVWAHGIGKCAKTATGLPPHASRGYGVCYPNAPRQCPDYQEAPP